ncbi:MAG: TonB-dependent receptor plug domain-containing protein [Gemmatimonadaceae bacterium]
MSPSCTGQRSLSRAPRSPRLASTRGLALCFSLAAAPISIAPNNATAQACSTAAGELSSLPAWNPPLDRRISLHLSDISLRDALDRISTQSSIHLSYTTETVPLDSRVCASFDSVPVGSVLTLLLRETTVLPIAAGGDLVVLAPSRTRAVTDAHDRIPKMLDRVVITGNAIEAPERRLTVAMNVVSGAQVARYSEGNMGQALSDAVPGLWVWQSAPTSLLAHYGSIRGSSSFGSSYPKIYVDGIELSNPLLVTQFAPETIDRIEIIRGPQGAALYGTDAISGVINIVTRHDGSDGGPSAIVRSTVGVASSSFVPRGAITQDHAVSLRGGSNAQSGSLSFSSGGVGEYLPGAFVRHVTGSAGFRAVRSKFIATGTARLLSSKSSDPISPLFSDSVSATRAGLVIPESVQEYTAGGTATFIANDVWTNTIVAGFDGSRVSNIPDYHTPLPSASGQDVGAAGGNADLTTLRFSSVAKVGTPGKLESSLTLSAENSWLDFRSQMANASTQGTSTFSSIVRRMTSAGVTQANFAWHDAGFLTAGLRLERNSSLGATSTYSALPMLGIAALRDMGPVTVKLRSAYGRGIRAATTPIREMAWVDPGQSRLLDLNPEQQSGIETGMDLFLGRTFGLQVTRFDQLASGLIQRVAYVYDDHPQGSRGGDREGPGEPGSTQSYAPSDRHIWYVLQNVGQITNRGWEVKGDVQLPTFTLSATYSTVDSRVRRVAANYIGDMRVGDRMLEVPARTGSLSAAWLGGGWNSSITASRSWDWIDYDRVGLAGAFSNSTQSDAQLVGQQLRNYWLRYTGVTRLRASVGRNLYRGFSFNVNGENLLNRQHGEPDNITVVPGRTISFGLRAIM